MLACYRRVFIHCCGDWAGHNARTVFLVGGLLACLAINGATLEKDLRRHDASSTPVRPPVRLLVPWSRQWLVLISGWPGYLWQGAGISTNGGGNGSVCVCLIWKMVDASIWRLFLCLSMSSKYHYDWGMAMLNKGMPNGTIHNWHVYSPWSITLYNAWRISIWISLCNYLLQISSVFRNSFWPFL